MANLNALESAALTLLWDEGGLSASELASRLAANDRIADHAHTLTLLRELERKGAVERRQSGRGATYVPLITKDTAQSHILGRLLTGETETHGLNVVVLRESDVDAQDWADLQAEIAERKKRRET